MRRSVIAQAAVALAAVVLGTLMPLAQTESAEAANAADFDPGYLIDDAIFYDASSMNYLDVQSFLNSRVGTCQAGRTCLKGYAQVTTTIPADRYCSGYSGSSYDTAAMIIDKAARACSINQRALLVLLEKEQGIVSSTGPSQRAYDAATGFGCPDTAPCDPNVGGFYYQVYYAARQFQIYKANPNSFNHRAGTTKNILLNPNAGCGTKSVYIYNNATAGLYNYTPYTPNAAAMGNLYGIGDGCSSYGNRNFWRIFTDWFGNPLRYEVASGFAWYYDARGGANGVMGAVTGYLTRDESNGGGYFQRFRNGTLYTSAGGTAFVFNNEFMTKYASLYAQSGGTGWPASEQVCATNGICYQSFTGGTIVAAPTIGARVIYGGIATAWLKGGGPTGPLGAPMSDTEYATNSGSAGWVQDFQWAYYSASNFGSYAVSKSTTGSSWIAYGGIGGTLGWPTSDYRCVGVSCAQDFQNGALSTTKQWGSHAILWGYASLWRAQGGLDSLGAAFDDLRASNAAGGGWIQQFEKAAIVQTTAGTVTRFPYDFFYGYWYQTGGERGSLGWPIAAQQCAANACAERFTNAVVTVRPNGSPLLVIGGLAGAWDAAGGIAKVGPAVSGTRYSTASGGGWVQEFTAGTITQVSNGSPLFSPTGPILTSWKSYGAEATWLGWPTSAPTCSANGCVQNFQNGVGRSDANGAVRFTTS